ncbi:xylosyltransferase oxt-like isoform X2 [Macrosteles quadrilineatus]|uniref:xylosyltransferase oxt-like isoform X2 n=1 Tax=Macrosteles quadrilineatus TaxID=74068 RepID=UPI0023E1A357|nr:xylosyltransferase oxt-like isoform X2 [Macrosteles quadrilineatus]
MATTKELDVRWIRRYRIFCLGGCVICVIQVFLAYIFFTIHADDGKILGKYIISKKAPLELFDDRNDVESSRRFKEGLDDDEDDSPGNSNAVETRLKVPPDKTESKNRNKVPAKSKTDSHSPDATHRSNKTFSLRLEELDFVPMCEITGREAVSAIHRAKTQHCKQLLANITCLNLQGDLYPHQLPHLCPNNGMEAGKLLGCYKDEKAFRLLSGYYTNLKTTNSPQNCINLCLQSGFPYAGVQYVNECFCGNDEPLSTARLPDSSCNMKCPGDPREACGGYYTMNVYQTGIAKFSAQPPSELRRDGEGERAEGSEGVSRPVRVAFLLTLNGRAVRQVYRLIKALFHRDHYFYIHVDARQDYMFRELLALEMQLSNVRLSRRRHSTIWGGASLLTMLLESMRELVDADWEWDFVINLSESDFPVKKNSQLVEFLTSNRDLNFVKSHGREVQRFIQKQGLDKTFAECEAHMWRAGERRLPWGVVVDGGSDWVALSRPFVTYLTREPRDDLISGLLTVFKYTLLPAESFFHTTLRNSEFCASYVDNNLHVTNWKRRLGCKCQYKHVVDWCGCSPNNFKTEDWLRLQGTDPRPLFFARKFEPIVNQEIIFQLEEWLYGPYPSNVSSLHSYWESVYHYQDVSPQYDDTLGTVAASLTRHATRHLSDSAVHCSVSAVKVYEITSYLHNDYYKGTLIKYSAKVKGQDNLMTLETWFRPQSNFTVLHNSGFAQRIKALVVSSQFDQKEQMFRNLARVLGVWSEPSVAVTLVSGSSGANLTLLWVDPTGVLADVSEASVDETSAIYNVKPTLKTPLLPGVWWLKVVVDNRVVAHTDFLVSPLQFSSGVVLTQQQARFQHSGPTQSYHVQDSPLQDLLDAPDPSLAVRAEANAHRYGKDLTQWIDTLVARFYSVVESCAVTSSTLELCQSLQLEPCVSTSWSSLTPDPKSTVTAINKTTGRLSRW